MSVNLLETTDVFSVAQFGPVSGQVKRLLLKHEKTYASRMLAIKRQLF